MREREFQGWVIDVAQQFGWRVWHVAMPMRHIGKDKMVPDSRARGLPDLILMHEDPPRLIFAELKGTGGKLSEAQREFLHMAYGVASLAVFGRDGETAAAALMELPSRSPVGAYSWRPGDEEMIETILRVKVLA